MEELKYQIRLLREEIDYVHHRINGTRIALASFVAGMLISSIIIYFIKEGF